MGPAQAQHRQLDRLAALADGPDDIGREACERQAPVDVALTQSVARDQIPDEDATPNRMALSNGRKLFRNSQITVRSQIAHPMLDNLEQSSRHGDFGSDLRAHLAEFDIVAGAGRNGPYS